MNKSPLFVLLLLIAALAPASAAATDIDLPVYDMTVALAADQSWLEIEGEILVPASVVPRTEVLLGLSEALGTLELELSGERSGRGSVTRGELIPGHTEGWGTYPYTLTLDAPVPAGESLRLAFRCRGEEAGAFVYHLGAPVTFASGINTAWYPQVRDPRVEESGWSGLRATGEISFALPPELQIYTAGRGLDATGDADRFAFELPIFFAFSAGPYRVLEATGDSQVAGYFLRQRENESDYIEGSAAVLEVLETTFGEYPHSRFAVVEVPTADAHAAGFSGASLDGFILATGAFLDRRFNTAYFGHEIGHQWWGNLVSTSGDRGGMMLSEGTAQFGSLVAVEALEGAAAGERYRRTGYPGYVALQSGVGYLSIAAAGFDAPIPDANEGPAARIIADGKGFQVWNILADQVGRKRFRQALRELVARHTLTPISWDDFLSDLEDTLDEDLQWFYDQWFEQAGAPEPRLDWSLDGDVVRVEISQVEPFYRMRLEVEIEDAEGRRTMHLIETTGETTTAELVAPSGVASVTLDPHFRMLRWTPEYRAQAEALAVSTRARLTRWGGDSTAAEAMLREALSSRGPEASPDPFGQAFSLESQLGSVLAERQEPEEARAHLEAALRAPSRRTDELPWVYYSLGKVALELEDHDLLREVQRSIVAADLLAGGTGAPEALREALHEAAPAHSR